MVWRTELLTLQYHRLSTFSVLSFQSGWQCNVRSLREGKRSGQAGVHWGGVAGQDGRSRGYEVSGVICELLPTWEVGKMKGNSCRPVQLSAYWCVHLLPRTNWLKLFRTITVSCTHEVGYRTYIIWILFIHFETFIVHFQGNLLMRDEITVSYTASVILTVITVCYLHG